MIRKHILKCPLGRPLENKSKDTFKCIVAIIKKLNLYKGIVITILYTGIGYSFFLG